MTVLLAPGEPAGFVDDPVASHSAQFGLGRPMGIPAGRDAASPAGVRPWNLRAARVMGPGARVGAWRYDHDRQIAVTLDGRLVLEVVAVDPTADSATDLDGDGASRGTGPTTFAPTSPASR